MSKAPHIETLAFETDGGLGQMSRIGLIILQTDQTLEYEMAELLNSDGVVLYHTRIPNEMEVTPETLAAMALEMPRTAALLPESFGFDAIGYCCTSGATVIGEARVDEIIRDVHPNAKTSNPITAVKTALAALGIKRVALVTPYAVEVTSEMQKNLQAAGFETTAVATFNESDDFTVARITSDSLSKAVMEIGARDDVDGVVVSCTSLRGLPVIADAEAALGKPVITSNQALAWHLGQLAGSKHTPENAGQLFQKQL